MAVRLEAMRWLAQAEAAATATTTAVTAADPESAVRVAAMRALPEGLSSPTLSRAAAVAAATAAADRLSDDAEEVAAAAATIALPAAAAAAVWCCTARVAHLSSWPGADDSGDGGEFETRNESYRAILHPNPCEAQYPVHREDTPPSGQEHARSTSPPDTSVSVWP